MSAAYNAFKNSIPRDAGHSEWEFACRTAITYLRWTTGCTVAGGGYGLFVAALRWSLSGKGEAFVLMPPYLMVLGAVGGAIVATAIVAIRGATRRSEPRA